MLKDRKFWTGLVLGAAIMGSVSLIQPLIAAPAAPSETEYLKAIAGALVKMRDGQSAMQKDISEIRANSASINKGIEDLSKTQGFNQH